MPASRRRPREDRGAVAVISAILALLLLGLGALAVDIGHAYAKRALLQTDVDLAVTAAAAELEDPDTCGAPVVDTATTFLEKAENRVPGQPPVDLSNGDPDDGAISCEDWQVRLVAPRAEVELGLGRVLSEDDHLDVGATATAQIMSPRDASVVPFFAVQGCDSGPQTIRDPSGEPTSPTVPDLEPSSDPANRAEFTIAPTSAPSGLTSLSMTLSGRQLRDVDRVGFTGPGGPTYHHEAVPGSVSSTSVTVQVPWEVLAVEDTWYVRVRTTDGRWSATPGAQPFTVGEEKLYCDARNEGNFGTVDVPRSDSAAGQWLALNMIHGVEPSLAIHPSPNGECHGQPGSVESISSPVDGTNCLASETGLKIDATNDGLVTGVAGSPGRLDTDSTSGCSRNGTSSRTPGTVKGHHLNDDVLSCFIVNGADIGDLVSGAGDGFQALSSDVFLSPRFFWVPVVDTDPATGKKSWPIVDFRPAFVTDQSLTATRDAPGALSSLNGLEVDSRGITEVRVVLFSEDALPEFAPARGGEVPYSGSGTKVIVLVE